MVRRATAVFATAMLAILVCTFVWWDEAEGETYEQVVDNSDKGRFAASGSWKESDSGEAINGKDYRFALPAKKGAHALFKVKIPADGEYAVYARWPELPGLNEAARVGVETTYGTEWTEVDQTRDGGRWVRVGVYEMREGDDYSVKISRDTGGRGNVVADAVKVQTISSYEDEPPPAPEQDEAAPSEAPAEGSAAQEASGEPTAAERTTANHLTKGPAAVREARRYLGTRYVLGGAAQCRPFSAMDCTCLTSTVYRKFGWSLSDVLSAQYRSGRAVTGTLRPGDLVFFREGGREITHVGIYSGNGKLVHASSYFGKVVEGEMKYIRGYTGARRLL